MPSSDAPVQIDFKENGDWVATITDAKGKAIVSFSYVVTPKAVKGGGVTPGVYKRADEDYKGKGVVTPKRPSQLEAEALEEWETKTLIEQGTKPYEAP